MGAKMVKEALNIDDIMMLLEKLDASPNLKGNIIECITVCHGGDSHKLIYYIESNSFTCFTGGCGTFDIYGLIGNVLKLSFYDSYKYICSVFGIQSNNMLYTPKSNISIDAFKKFKRLENNNEIIEHDIIDKSIFNCFHNIYHPSWSKDGISKEIMKKYGICFNIIENQIVIPHNDKDGNLIGMRVRNLKEKYVDDGKKYMPLWYNGQMFNHATGTNLYGLDMNMSQIRLHKKLIIVESEKSVMQINTMHPEMSIGVAICGSSLTNYQINIIKQLPIDEIIIGMDKEFEEMGDNKDKFFRKKIRETFINPLKLYFKISVMWDLENMINYKSSPSDHGKEAFDHLFKNRIFA